MSNPVLAIPVPDSEFASHPRGEKVRKQVHKLPTQQRH